MSYLSIVLWTGLAVVLGALLCYALSFHFFVYFFACRREKRRPIPPLPFKPSTKFAVMIPARDEGKAIIPLLTDFQRMDYPRELFDVYVIVPDRRDENYQRAKEFGFESISRADGASNKILTKGGALSDAYDRLTEEGRDYDAFLIFDADGSVGPDFLLQMDALRARGYDTGSSVRDFDNRFDNWITASDSLFFTFVNGFSAVGRNRIAQKGYLTGSGYYVDSWILKEVGGWIWRGLTEDVELTDYCLHDPRIRMGFSREAKVSDELSSEYRQAHKQHLRWMFGYFVSKGDWKLLRNGRIENPVLFWDYHVWGLFIIVLLVLLELYSFLCLGFFASSFFVDASHSWWYLLLFFSAQIFWLVNTFLIAGALMACDFTGKLDDRGKLFTLLSFPLDLFEYAYAFFEGLLFPKRWRTWDKVRHVGMGKASSNR